MILTWASFNNLRMLLMVSMPVVIFYLIWLINGSEAIRSEEGTLLDLVCWPDGNAIPVIIACGSIIAVVVQFYGLYQLFKAGIPKEEYDVTKGMFYFIWALIIMTIIFLAIIFYSGLQSTIIRAKIKGGITKAMLRYSTHLPSKVAIDRLQTRFHCCGRVNYKEWFYIPWFSTEESIGFRDTVPVVVGGTLVGSKTQNSPTVRRASRKFVIDSVPYSCCSIDVMQPCIHHGITKAGAIYKYNPLKLTIWTAGCEEKLIMEMMTVSWRFNTVMALLILAMILQLITVRYLHTAYKRGLHAGNHVTCTSYLLHSVTHSDLRDSRSTLFRKKKRERARTLEWVTEDNRRKYESSDVNSSEELLKSIHE